VFAEDVMDLSVGAQGKACARTPQLQNPVRRSRTRPPLELKSRSYSTKAKPLSDRATRRSPCGRNRTLARVERFRSTLRSRSRLPGCDTGTTNANTETGARPLQPSVSSL